MNSGIQKIYQSIRQQKAMQNHMQLVPSIINHPYFKHVGGVGEIKRGLGQTDNLDEGEDQD